MPNGEQFDPFIKLRTELARAAAEIGLGLVPQAFTIIPGEDRLSNHHAHVLFEIDPDALKTPEQKKTDDTFNQMMTMEKQSEHEKRVEEARAKMLGHIKSGDILPPDDDDDTPAE